MATVSTIVEIAAPPALVRALFLDFHSLSKWHSGHFRSISVLESATAKPEADANAAGVGPIGEKLAVGDKIRIDLGFGMAFKAYVRENTPHRFVWDGGWSYVLNGAHSFQFDESTSTPGGTTLKHGETFTGPLVTLCRPFMKSNEEQTSPGFEKFNADLKREAEKRAALSANRP